LNREYRVKRIEKKETAYAEVMSPAKYQEVTTAAEDHEGWTATKQWNAIDLLHSRSPEEDTTALLTVLASSTLI